LRQRLVLTLPAGLSPDRLRAAFGAGDVAAVVLDADGPTAPSLVTAAQGAGAAALLRGTGWPAPYGADGLHADHDGAALLDARVEGAVCGVRVASRHDAMVAGERGADYVWFDGADGLDTACALAAWWQRLFEVPAIVAGPSDDTSLAAMIGTRAEFVAMVDAFGDDHDEHRDPAKRIARANAALDEVAEGSGA